MYSRVARNRSGLRGSEGGVDVCKIWFYICRVVRDLHLGTIDSDHCCFSDMETRFSVHHRS
jgi:hypothetical protein